MISGSNCIHAINFLCEDMKVKIILRFRGREMAHKEFGFQQIEKFVKEVAPYGHPDSNPKLIGKGINVMLSPLPRAKRAKNPNEKAAGKPAPPKNSHPEREEEDSEENPITTPIRRADAGGPTAAAA